jgi:two-component system phosphate regulon response regulator OmpR
VAIRVLIIDDDEKLGSLLTQYMRQFDIEATAANRPSKGLQLLKSQPFDLLILDLMMPEQDGFAVCKTVRASMRIPIIMLTARGEITDRVMGLELGADDYLAKPFEPRELVARIRAILRRNDQGFGGVVRLRSGALVLDIQKRQATLEGKDLGLTTAEFDLLHLLMRKAGQTLSRDQIMEELKGAQREVFNRTIDVSMSRLRHKLGEGAKAPHYFKTIWGAGYAFIAPVESDS